MNGLFYQQGPHYPTPYTYGIGSGNGSLIRLNHLIDLSVTKFVNEFDKTKNPLLKSWQIFYLGIVSDNRIEFEKATGIKITGFTRKPSTGISKYDYDLTIKDVRYKVQIKYGNFRNGTIMKIKIKNLDTKKTTKYFSK
jgi:hypothetical protein